MNKTIEILYEDKYLTLIYKPEGLLSTPYLGSGKNFAGRAGGSSALDILENIRRKRGLVHGSCKPAAVHRLDRETSGIMMFALNAQAQKLIMNNWHKMLKRRSYCALAENLPPQKPPLPETGLIDAPLVQNIYHQSYVPHPLSKETAIRRYKQKIEGQSARTNYRIIQRGKNYTFFELELDTGRKNQIRAHLAWLGLPIAGDKTYRAKTDPCGRLCLHAKTLEFTHPFTGESLAFTVNEPDLWKKLAL